MKNLLRPLCLGHGRTLAILSFSLGSLLLTVPARAQYSNLSVPMMQVTGTGAVSAFPNAARLTLLLKATKPRLREAMDETQRNTRVVLNLLKPYVPDTLEIKTSLISTNRLPKWDQAQKKEIGADYEAYLNVIFTLRDLNQMQRLTEELLKTRVYEISQVSYFNTEGAALVKQAQEEAVRDAIETTSRLAKAGNIKLGRVLYLNVNGEGGQGADASYDTYQFQTFGKGMGGRGVAASGQLIVYRASILLQTAIE